MAVPKDVLTKGVKVLKPLLRPKGFRFRFGREGNGSGGPYAWGEFVRKDRRLQLHFRYSLGLVRYYVGEESASHESYMRELEVWDQCRYPGFSDDPLGAFVGLAHDLSFASDFLCGSAAMLRQAVAKEAANTATRQADLMARDVGDKRKIDQLRQSFRDKRFSQVVQLAAQLKYPDRMSESERKMVGIAQRRTELQRNS
ncbi:MAG: hypothetical protein ACRD4R_16440 [Candidatus Acidiferrales bacterium]